MTSASKLEITELSDSRPGKCWTFGQGTFRWVRYDSRPRSWRCYLYGSDVLFNGWGAKVWGRSRAAGHCEDETWFVAHITDNTGARYAARRFETMESARAGTQRAMRAIAEGRSPAKGWKIYKHTERAQ